MWASSSDLYYITWKVWNGVWGIFKDTFKIYGQTSKLGQIFTCAEDFLTEFQKFNLKFI